MMFNGSVSVGLTGLLRSQWSGILHNLTYYELTKRQATPHFWPPGGRFQNPFHDGYMGNIIAFWTKSRRMTFDPTDPWAESNRIVAEASTGGSCVRACRRTVRSLFPWCSCAHRSKTADAESNTSMKEV